MSAAVLTCPSLESHEHGNGSLSDLWFFVYNMWNKHRPRWCKEREAPSYERKESVDCALKV